MPSQEEIDKAILQKRKELLLKKYVGNNGETEEAKSLAKSLQIQEMHARIREREKEEDDVDMKED